MKLRSIEPYWILKNGLINSYPSLRNNITCDILIVGGGITGALMAFQLSKEGYATVIIDRRDIAMGSTSATTAMIQYDNRILVGGGDESFKNGARRDRLIEKKEAFLLKSFQAIIPSLNVIPDFAWAGTFGVTKDALPYIGPHPDYPDSYFVLVFGGNGITFSVMGMKIISDALAGRHNAFLGYYRFDR